MKMPFTLLLCCAAALVGCLSTPSEPLPVESGVYLVKRSALSQEELTPLAPNEKIVPYDYRVVDPAATDPLEQVVLDVGQVVPLQLSVPPEGVRQQDGRLSLFLKLTPEASRTLETFTERHLNEHVAIVVGGQIISLHKVRSVIRDGQVRITRCTDDACEVLQLKLSKP